MYFFYILKEFGNLEEVPAENSFPVIELQVINENSQIYSIPRTISCYSSDDFSRNTLQQYVKSAITTEVKKL